MKNPESKRVRRPLGGKAAVEYVLRLSTALVDSSDDAMIGVDTRGTIITWNPAAERLYDYSAADAAGRSIEILLPDERAEELRERLQRAMRGDRTVHEVTVRRTRTGAPVDVATTVSPIRNPSGALTGAAIIDRDLTEQRWVASTLDSTLVTLEAALAAAREAEARSRRFLADAAHQLRTPIAGIRAAAENLLEGVEPPDRGRLLSDLVRETARASRLIGSLLRIAHLDENEPLEPAPCDVLALCAAEIDRAWALAPHLDFALSADVIPDDRPALDANAIKEILANLLDNARRYASRNVRVRIDTYPGGLELTVRDDGPGVPEGSEERVFERFVSLGDRAGSGLGLAIARELAAAHGGNLSYLGVEGGFLLRLPVPDWARDEDLSQ